MDPRVIGRAPSLPDEVGKSYNNNSKWHFYRKTGWLTQCLDIMAPSAEEYKSAIHRRMRMDALPAHRRGHAQHTLPRYLGDRDGKSAPAGSENIRLQNASRQAAANKVLARRSRKESKKSNATSRRHRDTKCHSLTSSPMTRRTKCSRK